MAGLTCELTGRPGRAAPRCPPHPGANSLAGGVSTPLATTTATAFTVTVLAPATVYSLCVTAHDAAGNVSPASGTVTTTTDYQSSTVDPARQRPTTESSHTQGHACANAVDDDPNSYWKSSNNAFPQWLQVDLGAAQPARRIVLAVCRPRPRGATGPRPSPWQGARTAQPSPRSSAPTATPSTLRPVDREQRHPQPSRGHHHAPSATDLHRQHRLAGRPDIGTEGPFRVDRAELPSRPTSVCSRGGCRIAGRVPARRHPDAEQLPAAVGLLRGL